MVLAVLEGVEEGIIPDSVRERRRNGNRDMPRCWLVK